ncbi:hypothetical protein FDECE_2246 [Fusarium decemcellulare]|nr:hypothetical protein FDECE_2246 [Fusarium decemcellulare]
MDPLIARQVYNWENSYLYRLPDELIIDILRELRDDETSFFCLRQVSRRWRRLINDAELKNPSFSTFNRFNSSEMCYRVVPAPAPSSRDESSDPPSSDDDDDDSLQVPRAKRRHNNDNKDHGAKAPNTELFSTTFKADRDASLINQEDATKRSDWFDEPTKQGPTRASTNVRTTTTIDFAPDVCKDYRKTGFCAFGDSCVFLHDRSDMKQGWQLDREWETITRGRKTPGGTVVSSAHHDDIDPADDEAETTMLDKIPSACIICEGSYREPIVTSCGHYFCEPCALKRYRQDPTCAACGAGTNGVFNAAKRLKKLLEKKKERAAKHAEAISE